MMVPIAVPEPSTLGLIGLGLPGFGAERVRHVPEANISTTMLPSGNP
jgi:PEP-CTERM motif